MWIDIQVFMVKMLRGWKGCDLKKLSTSYRHFRKDSMFIQNGEYLSILHCNFLPIPTNEKGHWLEFDTLFCMNQRLRPMSSMKMEVCICMILFSIKGSLTASDSHIYKCFCVRGVSMGGRSMTEKLDSAWHKIQGWDWGVRILRIKFNFLAPWNKWGMPIRRLSNEYERSIFCHYFELSKSR